MVTDAQVRLFREKRMQGKTQEAAAAMAGMSVRTARDWEAGPLPSAMKAERTWRTRPDPFADVWASEVEPLLIADEDGGLEAQAVFAELQRRHPQKFESGQLRSLQRRFREWRALRGPDKVVYFQQEHRPGRMASIDFTHCTELRVTIAGAAFAHLLFHFVLAWSGWHHVELAFGETFEALVHGLQSALWTLGATPEHLRMDNLSAATHEIRETGGRSLTKRFADVLDHYELTSSRIRPGESHENGVVEKGHDLMKSALEQALRIRGSREFADVPTYMAFVRHVIARDLHVGREAKFAVERTKLRRLPTTRLPEYTKLTSKVRCWSTIQVVKRAYSVPSRLIGHDVEIRLFADELQVRVSGRTVETIPRMRGDVTHRIDYRHVIWSLVRKPGAFAAYKYREDLYPSLVFRRAYDALRSSRGDRADIEYVRILHLAASTSEALVERALAALIEANTSFDYVAVKALASPETPSVPTVHIGVPDLAAYDDLIGIAGGAA